MSLKFAVTETYDGINIKIHHGNFMFDWGTIDYVSCINRNISAQMEDLVKGTRENVFISNSPPFYIFSNVECDKAPGLNEYGCEKNITFFEFYGKHGLEPCASITITNDKNRLFVKKALIQLASQLQTLLYIHLQQTSNKP